jgi:lipopolysaccharide export system permease protein
MIFERSLVRELANAASAIFITLLTIVLTIALVRFLGQAAAGQVANESVIALISFSALNYLPVLLQLTVFVAVLLALTRSYRDSEMVVWMASGIGIPRWLRPVFKFATPVAVLVAALSFFATPWANRQASEFKLRFEQRTDVARVAPGQFRESADGQKVFFVEGLSGTSSNVRNIFVSSQQHGRVGVIVSQSGNMRHMPNGDDFIVLKNGRRYEGMPGQSDYKVMAFEQYGVRVESKPPDFTADDSMKIRSTTELVELASQRSNEDKLHAISRRALGELVWRIGLPLSVLALALLAIPLSFVNPRAGRSANLMIALLVYFTYSNAINLVQNWTSQGRVEFAIAWWAAHAVVLVIGLAMLDWRNRLHRPWRAWVRIVSARFGFAQ